MAAIKRHFEKGEDGLGIWLITTHSQLRIYLNACEVDDKGCIGYFEMPD
jgi:hypothetical protein